MVKSIHNEHFVCTKHHILILYENIMDDSEKIYPEEARDLVDFIDGLQASGRYTFAADDVRSAVLKTKIALKNALGRLKKRGRVTTPRRGFYVIVPTEYRSAGAPPASWFIDDLMSFLGQPYYVGMLSAAAVHGASHQQPMVFQVVTDRPTRSAIAGRARIEFFKSISMADAAVEAVQTETGTMRVSSPEVTALDLIRFVHACGGWSNVATVLSELAEKINPDELRHTAELRKTAEVQRLGFLLDLSEQPRLSDSLLRVLAARRYRPVALAPDAPRGDAAPVYPWRVIPNETVELDL